MPFSEMVNISKLILNPHFTTISCIYKINVKMGRLGGNSTTTFMIALGIEFSTAVLIRRGRKIFIIHVVAFIVIMFMEVSQVSNSLVVCLVMSQV